MMVSVSRGKRSASRKNDLWFSFYSPNVSKVSANIASQLAVIAQTFFKGGGKRVASIR
jgi:hypothetical protein